MSSSSSRPSRKDRDLLPTDDLDENDGANENSVYVTINGEKSPTDSLSMPMLKNAAAIGGCCSSNSSSLTSTSSQSHGCCSSPAISQSNGSVNGSETSAFPNSLASSSLSQPPSNVNKNPSAPPVPLASSCCSAPPAAALVNASNSAVRNNGFATRTTANPNAGYVPTFLRQRRSTNVSSFIPPVITSIVCHRVNICGVRIPTILLISTIIIFGVFFGMEAAILSAIGICILICVSAGARSSQRTSSGATAGDGNGGGNGGARIRTIRDLPPTTRPGNGG